MSLICLFFIDIDAAKLEAASQVSTTRELQITTSTITPIQSFNDIRSELDKVDQDTLVIFDVDDVLLTYHDMVLRPCGARFRPDSWKDIDPKEIPQLISIMLNEGKIILVEPTTPHIVNKLRNQGAKIMALTAARTGKFGVIKNAEDWRLTILKGFDLDFSKSSPATQLIYFDDGAKKENDYSVFKDGILFLGDEKNTKGALLVQFLDKLQWKPKRVIFFDDKMSHLKSVETALNEAKIPFQGYHYQGVETLPGALNEQIAEVQFSYLRKNHKWLSDLEAKKEEKSSSSLSQ